MTTLTSLALDFARGCYIVNIGRCSPNNKLMTIATMATTRCIRGRGAVPLLLIVAAAIAFASTAAAADIDAAKLPPAATRKVDFLADVQPLFRRHCISCHGAEKQKSDYRLDQKSAALTGGSIGGAIVPGKSAASKLIHNVAGLDDDMRMPPKGNGLSAEEISILRAWIDQGAAWPQEADAKDAVQLWSLRPLAKPALPQVKDQAWVRNSIDAFVLAKLEEKGMRPAPPADPRVLIRRLYFDLTGLPPTPEEVVAFVKECEQEKGHGEGTKGSRDQGTRGEATDAQKQEDTPGSAITNHQRPITTHQSPYDRLVDRLLASPRYGERWARHWMDVVHFAETHGHDEDKPRPNAWPYRDYLIRAFNEDKPYARFIEDQVAGDVLHPADPWATAALGMLAAGPWDQSSQMGIQDGTTDKKLAQVLDRDDMIATVISTFNSVTIHCARCHNHKFDPITIEDYYALQAVFAGVDRANRSYEPDAGVRTRRDALMKEKAALAAGSLASAELFSDANVAYIEQWEKSVGGDLTAWTVLEPGTFTSAQGATLTKQPDHSLLSGGKRPEKDTYTIAAKTSLKGITAVRLEVLTDDSLSLKGPGRQDNGNLHLSEFRVAIEGAKGSRDQGTEGKGADARSDESAPAALAGHIWPCGTGSSPLGAKCPWNQASAPDTGMPLKAAACPCHTESDANDGPTPPKSDNSKLETRNSKPAPLPIRSAVADWDQEGWGIARAIDGKPETAWGIYPKVGESHFAIFELEKPANVEGDEVTLTFTLEQLHGGGHLIGRPRLSVTNSPKPKGLTALPAAVVAILKTAPAARSEEQKRALALHVLRERNAREIAKLPPPQLVYAATSSFPQDGNFKPPLKPRDVFVLRRGDVLQPLAPAEPGSLSCVSGIESRFALKDASDEGARRAALARWISHRDNVLTWRSIANRIWHYHLGRGIVDTPNDLGKMGGEPSHPQLLDWLAVTLRDDMQGSLKQLHKLIVTSNTYRQSTRHEEQFAKLDADNRLLWRMNRLRLDAEQVRDAMLAISGKLDLTMYGPSVKQFIEKPGVHVTPIVDYANFDVDHPNQFRRSVYRFVFRTLPDPLMDALDCPDLSQLSPRRSVSVTAQQALEMLNNKFMVRQCEHIAARVQREMPGAESLEPQVQRVYALALNRPASNAELAAVVEYAKKHGLANAVRILINSNEFLFLN